MSKPMDLVTKTVEEMAKIRAERMEFLAAAFISQTGLDPTECELVEQRHSDMTTWHFRKREISWVEDEVSPQRAKEFKEFLARGAGWNCPKCQNPYGNMITTTREFNEDGVTQVAAKQTLTHRCGKCGHREEKVSNHCLFCNATDGELHLETCELFVASSDVERLLGFDIPGAHVEREGNVISVVRPGTPVNHYVQVVGKNCTCKSLLNGHESDCPSRK